MAETDALQLLADEAREANEAYMQHQPAISPEERAETLADIGELLLGTCTDEELEGLLAYCATWRERFAQSRADYEAHHPGEIQ
jgi:hypothetical protein